MYYVYIVASRSRNLYVGVTSEIEIRVLQHKNGAFEGFPKQYNCTGWCGSNGILLGRRQSEGRNS